MSSFAAPTSSEWNDILAGKNGNTFVILKIEKKNISVLHTGKGLAELKKILSTPESEESVLGIGFIVYGVDNRGGITSKRQKAFRVDWMGSRVSPMKRGLQLKCKAHVSEYFSSCNITIQSNSIDDLDEKELTEQLLASGGAHKPKCYDFGDGVKTIEEILAQTEAVTNIPVVEKSSPTSTSLQTKSDLAKKMEETSLKSNPTSNSISDKAVPLSSSEVKVTKAKPTAVSTSTNSDNNVDNFDSSLTHSILLTSSYGSGGGGQAGKCKKLEDTFSALKIRFKNVDGADAKNKDLRNKLCK